MKYEIVLTSSFKKELKQIKKRNKDINKLTTIVNALANDEELDAKLAEIIKLPEIQEDLLILADAEFEKNFYEQLRREVEIEIKKDEDRIKNAYNVFKALETGNLDELFQDPETEKWKKFSISMTKSKNLSRKDVSRSFARFLRSLTL